MGKNTLPSRPGAIIGYRKNGSPIRLIAGGDGTDDPKPDDNGGTPDPTRLTHKQAINRMKDCRDELERIGAKEHRTTEDDRQFAEMVREVDVLNDHVRGLERQASLARVKQIVDDPSLGKIVSGVPEGRPGVDRGRWDNGFDADPILEPDSVIDRRFRNPWDLSEVRVFGRSREEVGQEMKARALSAIDRMAGANDEIRKGATSIIEQFDNDEGTISQMALATSSPEYLRGWIKLARGRGGMVTQDEQKAIERAMSLTDAQGGFLVPFQLDPTVILTSRGSRNQIREVARQVVATGDVWNGVSADEVDFRWASEASESGDNAPPFDQPTVTVHKGDGFVPISIEALGDEANVTSEVGRLLAAGKDTLEAKAFATGTGVGQPFGIVTALANSTNPDVVVLAAGGTALVAEDVRRTIRALASRYRMNASWLANWGIYSIVSGLDTAGGADLWVQLREDLPAVLIGKRTYEAEEMTDTLALNANVLVAGDFENYVIADRIGFTVELIPHLFGANRRPTGQRGWYAYFRVGADSVNDDGFRLLRMAAA